MTTQGDYTDDMSATMMSADDPIDLDDRVVEALLSTFGAQTIAAGRNPALSAVIEELRSFGASPTPVPSAELAAMMYENIIPLYPPKKAGVLQARVKMTGWLVAGAAIVLCGAGIAAMNDSLPDDAQTAVSKVVNNLTPFHVDPAHPSSDHDGSSSHGGPGGAGGAGSRGSSGSTGPNGGSAGSGGAGAAVGPNGAGPNGVGPDGSSGTGVAGTADQGPGGAQAGQGAAPVSDAAPQNTAGPGDNAAAATTSAPVAEPAPTASATGTDGTTKTHPRLSPSATATGSVSSPTPAGGTTSTGSGGKSQSKTG